ncbi:hypothetical protein Tco_0873102 [Tanacetum coccineum]
MVRGDVDRCVTIALKKWKDGRERESLASATSTVAPMDGPARRRGRKQTDATFDLPGAYFSSKTLDDACKGMFGIQNEMADTSEARAAIYGSAHVTNQEALRVATAALSVVKEAADMTDIQEEERARKHSHRRQVPPSAGPGSPLSIVWVNEDGNERVVVTRCKVILDASRSQSQTWRSLYEGGAE